MPRQTPSSGSRWGTRRALNALCSVFLCLLLVAGVVLFVVWLGLRPHRPRFHLSSFSIHGGPLAGRTLAFNVSASNTNRKMAIYYVDAVQASVRYYDTLVASGQAISPWYQPNMTTTSIAAVLDVVGPTPRDASWPSFSEAAQAGRVPLRLHLSTAIRFRASVFHSARQKMYVDCDLAVGADGNLLFDYVNAPCDRYF